MKDEYEKQEKIPNEDAVYGIKKYTKDQREFHSDVMKLLTCKKYKDIPIDDCMVVFGRCYSVYIATELKRQGVL
jgi:hypothetical protein